MMIINLQSIFLFFLASQVLGCFCSPIPLKNNDLEEQNFIKRNPMGPGENQHGQSSGSQTNNAGLRPGRQQYRKFNLSSPATASAPAPSAPPLPSQHNRFERNRPEPIRTGRSDRTSHSIYTANHNPRHHYGGSSYSSYNSPPRGPYRGRNSSYDSSPSGRYDGRNSHTGARIGGAVAGEVGNAMIADALGMQPGMVMAPDHFGHTHMRYGYVTPIGGGGGGSSGDFLGGCLNCLTGNSGSSSP